MRLHELLIGISRWLTRLVFVVTLLLLPVQANADYGLINSTVSNVGNQLAPLFSGGTLCDASGGACGFVAIAYAILVRFRPLLTTIGFLVLTVAGIRMLVGQEDDAVDKMKTVASGAISGLVLVWLIEPFVRAFYGTRGEIVQGNAAGGAAIVNSEISGLINWALVLVATLAVFTMVLAALKSLGKSEDGVASLRKTMLSVAAGIILIVFRAVIADNFVANPNSPVAAFISPILRVVSFLLGFLVLTAIIIVIYAGINLILSGGSEERAGQSKSLLVRAVVGFVLVFVSLALVNFVIAPGV